MLAKGGCMSKEGCVSKGGDENAKLALLSNDPKKL